MFGMVSATGGIASAPVVKRKTRLSPFITRLGSRRPHQVLQSHWRRVSRGQSGVSTYTPRRHALLPSPPALCCRPTHFNDCDRGERERNVSAETEVREAQLRNEVVTCVFLLLRCVRAMWKDLFFI